MVIESLFKEILNAHIYDLVKHTPLNRAHILSDRFGHEIYMKREDQQSIFSFKIRGAYNKIKRLTEKEKDCGVICVSAGNHAQGVALSAKKLSLKAKVVMPVTTPNIKVQAVKRLGAEVIVYGDTYSDAAVYCESLVEDFGYTFIHPFEDPLVIAGQGTIARELLQDLPHMDMVFVPIGGGGLLAGIAVYLKTLRPDIKIIGVEPVESDGMFRSIQAGKRVLLPQTGTFADGVAVKMVGDLNFQIIQELCDDFVLVSNDEICSAIENVYEETRGILEPAGALSLSGLKKFLSSRPELSRKNLVCINSGANMNFQRMQFIAERVLTGDNRENLYAFELKEEKGALLEFCRRVISDKSITEFNYRFTNQRKAYIFTGIANFSSEEKVQFERQLQDLHYQYVDITHNELAKQHIRHMVGGSSSNVKHELLFRFEFPERPKALTDFLLMMGNRWNISLFHYRSHGTDFGRVLIGLQVPPEDRREFEEFLEKMRYPYAEETDNVAYHLFLKSLHEEEEVQSLSRFSPMSQVPIN
ncbi:MAG: threonine ammonia-lyase, biosynthetic [Oligoflexus sp.]